MAAARLIRFIDPNNQEHLVNLDQVADIHFIQHEGQELDVVVTLAANSVATDKATPHQLRTRGERALMFRAAVYAAAGLALVDAPVTEPQPLPRATSRQTIRRGF